MTVTMYLTNGQLLSFYNINFADVAEGVLLLSKGESTAYKLPVAGIPLSSILYWTHYYPEEE
jgi:hypothetical protein